MLRPTLGLRLVLSAVAIMSAAIPAFSATSQTKHSQVDSSVASDIQALLDQALYWYERYRFDLAGQRLNRILLLEPNDATAIKWKGLIDLKLGNVAAAKVWLDRLKQTAGDEDPQTIELKQSLLLATDLRQEFATLQFRSRKTEEFGNDWVDDLLTLFEQEPMGEAAIGYYDALSYDPASKAQAVAKVRSLVRRFPTDKRYRKLLADLGQTAIATAESPSNPTPTINRRTTTPIETPKAPDTPALAAPSEPELSDFAKGQALNTEGLALAEKGQLAQAEERLTQAVELNPQYPWFRFDLANFYEARGTPESSGKASEVMAKGRDLVPGNSEMVFASALLASGQNLPEQALKLLNSIPKDQWSAGMSALERRASYTIYIGKLNDLNKPGQYTKLANAIELNPKWLAEPAVQDMVVDLKDRRTATFSISARRGRIAGTQGVSAITDTIVPMELEVPDAYRGKVFFRADSYQADAGNYRSLATPSDANQFGYLATRSNQQIDDGANAPSSGNLPQPYFDNANQQFDGHLLAVGYRAENWRADIGQPVGNYPVKDWLGGVEVDRDIGETGLLRLTLARRMIDGSVLSGVGARDPETGQRWGGVRRNGLTTLYYSPWGDRNDFVGIARYNVITGTHVKTNREMNLQGIVSRRIWNNEQQNIDVGMSVFLWKFDHNSRFYTFGQGGYYSPQRFASISLPVTWTGSTERWSWKAQATVGKSRSYEAETDLYPFANATQRQALLDNNRNLTDAGGDGGGVSYGLTLQLEHKLTDRVALGINLQIDRSEDFNPDVFSTYLLFGLNGKIKLRVPPQGLTPYSEF